MAAVHEEGRLPAQIEQLAQKAAAGSAGAFDELYRLTRDRAYFVAFSITKNEDDALDILQDSYLKAWSKLGTLENPAVFGAWLNQIVGNTAKNFVKKHRPQLFQPAGDDGDPLEWQSEKDSSYVPDTAMDTGETRRLIMGIIDDLPEDQRLCVLMHYYNDLDLNEIAAALELPYETVRSRLRYAKRKISDGVESLEKKGTKLYGAAPIPLVVWLLKHGLAESSSRLPPLIIGGEAAKTGGTLAALSLPKIVAGISALLIVACGVTAATRFLPRPQEESTATQAAVPESEHAALPAAAGETFAFSLPPLPVFSGRSESHVYPQPDTAAALSYPTVGTTRTAAPPATAATAKPTTAATTKATTAAAKTSATTAPATTSATTSTRTTTTTTTTTTASSRRIVVAFHDYSYAGGNPYAYTSFAYEEDTRFLTGYNGGPAATAAPALHAVNGWTPVGWSTSSAVTAMPGIAAAEGAAISAAGDANYFGVYRRDTAITFNADGGTPVPDLNATFWYVSNPSKRDNVYMPGITMPAAPAKEGATFRHWLGDKGDTCGAGESVQPRSASYTAQWS